VLLEVTEVDADLLCETVPVAVEEEEIAGVPVCAAVLLGLILRVLVVVADEDAVPVAALEALDVGTTVTLPMAVADPVPVLVRVQVEVLVPVTTARFTPY
jgi:hypothetical protein